jgi:dTDP-4-amino-4,6-dideoxygalactose transaminase
MTPPSDFIPVADPGAAYRRLRPELDMALARVMASGRYVLADEVGALEIEFARWLAAGQSRPLPQTVTCASGTDAIRLALHTLDLPPGAGVIVPALAPSASCAAIVEAGLRPVFADVDAETGTLDTSDVARRLSASVGAVLAVHLYGNPCDLTNLLALGLPVLEDCAQAHGALHAGRRVGTFGQLAAWSFYPTKNLGAFGDGGAVTTADVARAERLRALRQYGWRARQISAEHGWNSRLDELQAALLRVRLVHLEADNERRRALAARYQQALPATLERVAARAGDVGAEHLFVVRHPDREPLRRDLLAAGVGTGVHYPCPLHLQPAYQCYGAGPGSLPVAERLAATVLSLPMHPELSDAQVDTVIAQVTRVSQSR